MREEEGIYIGGGGIKRATRGVEDSAATTKAEVPLINQQAVATAAYSPRFGAVADKAMAQADKDPLKAIREHYALQASGDPMALQRSLGPMISTLTKQGMAQKDQINKNVPRGGEQRLARENVDIATGDNVGKLTSDAYNNAMPNLEKTINDQVDQVLKSFGLATSALSGGSTSEYGAGNLYKSGADASTQAGGLYGKSGEIEAAKKGAQLGLLGSLAGAAGTAAGGAFMKPK